MLSKSYIESRKQIIHNWVIKNTKLKKNEDIENLTNHIFLKYYGKLIYGQAPYN